MPATLSAPAALLDWLGSVLRDLRQAARALRRAPGFAAVAVLSLAAGIGLNTVVFSVINTVFLQAIRGVPHPERVAFVGGRVSYDGYRQLRAGTRSLDGLAVYDMTSADVRWEDVAERGSVPAVSDDYFAVLGVRPALGTFFAARRDDVPAPTPAAVLDYVFWQERLGGAPDVVGRTIRVNGVPLTVVGVAPREFHGAGPARSPLWVPIGMLPTLEGRRAAWSDTADRRWRLIGRLRHDATVAGARTELRVLAARAPALFPAEPLGMATGRETWAGNDSPEKRIEFLLVTVVPLVVVVGILWIGCSNVANLLLARAVARRREIVVRLANGAPRGRLVRLLLTESALLATLGAAAGLLAASWAMRFVWATFPEASSLDVQLDRNVLAYTGAVAILSTLFFGLAPALQSTRVEMATALNGDGAGSGRARGGSRLRTFFLVSQVASSVALLVVASTFVRTLVSTYVGDQGARLDHLVLAQVTTPDTSAALRRATWERVRATLVAMPGVQGASLFPANGDGRATLVVDGSPTRTTVTVSRVDSAYFRTMTAPVVAGRALDASPIHALVNERAARRLWPGRSPLGARVALDSQAVEIVGVVRDGDPSARVYRALDDASLGAARLVVRTSGPAAPLVPTVRAALAPLVADPALVRVDTMREAAVGPLARLTRAVAALGALALALATIGLYGSIAFFTSQRSREIAIRLSIGAARVSVVRLLLAHGLRIVGIGSAIGIVVAGVAYRFMDGMIFGHWTLDLATLAIVVAVFGATTLAACVMPARHALRVDPMQVLRSE